MSPALSIEVLGETGRFAQLPERGRLVVGSDPERADLCVTGQGVAGVHCAIGRVRGGGWALRDLGSDFGTHVNGQRVETARLEAEDVLLVGSRRLRVFDPAAPKAKPKARPQPSPKAEPRTKPTPAAPAPARATGGDKPSLPGYSLERPLGRGAMGEVWLATQVSLARRVAIKMLSQAHEEDPQFVERFQAEARAAAALNHPNVVTVHDVGAHEGHHFLAMEFMAAGCLESRLAALGPIPWREALGILLDAARGLEYAESRGVVHRDIKPANLMQTENGITKICDLGLAVQLESEEVEAGGRRVFGTPHFIAPEVVRGARADARSDLYSLGATAYRLLSGHTPFEGENARAILRGVLQDEPEPLDERVPGLPPAVARLVDRLLEKDPDRRLPSAGVLVRELEALRANDGRPADAAAAAAATSWKPIALAAVAIAALAAAAFAIFGGDDEPAPKPPRGDGSSISAPGGAGVGPGERVEDGGPGEGAAIDDPPDGPTAPLEEGAPSTGEDAERLQEVLARNAYLELGELQLTEDERLARLMKIATEFAGTDTARAVQAEVDELRRTLTEEIAVERERAARLAAYEAALRESANLALEPPRPGIGLRGLRAVEGFEDLAGDADARALEQRVLEELLTASLAWADGRRAAADAAFQAGEFDAFVDALDDLVAAADLPTFELGDPPAVTRLREYAAEASERLARLDELRSEWRRDRMRREREILARALGPGSGFEAELAALDLAGAARRLREAEAAVGTEELRERATALRERVEAAAAALDALVAAWRDAGWKRRTVRDPRPDGGNVEVAGADDAGLLLEGGERLPWSAFGGAVEALDNLFHRRLERDWSPAELAGIGDLLLLQAVVATAREAGSELAGATPGSFSDGAAERLLAPYTLAVEWAREAGAPARAEAEQRAARRLAEFLQARGEGYWSVAAKHLERLLLEEASTALVTLLSDGSEWVEVEPPPPAGTPPDDETDRPDDPPAPSDGDGDGDGDEGGGEKVGDGGE